MLVGSDSSGQVRGSRFGLGMHIEIHAMIHKAGIEAIDVVKWCYFINCGSLWLRRNRNKVGGKAEMVLVKGVVREFLAKEETLYLPMCGVWRDGVSLHVYEDVVN
jgi:hypothetical protein